MAAEPRGRTGAGPNARPRTPPGRVAPALLLAALAAGFLAAGCAERDRVAAERRLLERERSNLEQLLALPADSPLIARADLVVALRSELFEAVLDEALPQSGPVGDRYRITLQAADVAIRSGMARVEMEARAALREQPDVFADVAVVGLLDVVALDPRSGVLRARVEILGVDTRQVAVRGLTPPAERLVEALARRRSEEFDDLLDDLAIPLSLSERVELPAVEGDVLSARGGRIPLEVSLRDVRALGDRLWLAIDAELGAPVARAGAGGWWGGSAPSIESRSWWEGSAAPTAGGAP